MKKPNTRAYSSIGSPCNAMLTDIIFRTFMLAIFSSFVRCELPVRRISVKDVYCLVFGLFFVRVRHSFPIRYEFVVPLFIQHEPICKFEKLKTMDKSIFSKVKLLFWQNLKFFEWKHTRRHRLHWWFAIRQKVYLVHRHFQTSPWTTPVPIFISFANFGPASLALLHFGIKKRL